MLEELAWLLSNLPSEGLDTASVFKLGKKLEEKAHVARCIHKMSAGTFVLGFPYLNRHCLREDLLGKLTLGSKDGHCVVGRFVIDDVGSLETF